MTSDSLLYLVRIMSNLSASRVAVKQWPEAYTYMRMACGFAEAAAKAANVAR